MIYTSAPIRLNKSVDGQTPYVHFKYSDDGGLTFTPYEGETPGKYLGLCADYTEADPTDVGKYKWSLIQGADGTPGTPGKDGTSVTILGSYDSEDELNAAHPTGELGDSYIVNGDLYVWDGSSWKNAGTIQGPAGEDGVGVSSITAQFYLSTAKTAPIGGSWVETMPTWSTGKYLWTRSKITYTDGTIAYTSPICDSSWEAVDELDKKLDMEEVFNRLTNNGAIKGIYMKDGQLYINASYVLSGEMQADLIKSGIIKSTSGFTEFDLDWGKIKLTDIDGNWVQLIADNILSYSADGKHGYLLNYDDTSTHFALRHGDERIFSVDISAPSTLMFRAPDYDTPAVLADKALYWRKFGGLYVLASSGAFTVEDVGTNATYPEGAVEASLTEMLSDMVANESRQVWLMWEKLGDWTVSGTLFKSSANYATFSGSCSKYGHVTQLNKDYYNGSWTPFEWVNPPMELGAEYRTTERFDGKVVYAKAINFGALPNASSKNAVYSSASATAIDVRLVLSDGCVVTSGPNKDRNFSNEYQIWVDNTKYNVRVITDADFSSLTAIAIVKYVKD